MSTLPLALALALVLAPTAAAAPILIVAWVPGGVTTDDAPEYYLKLTLSDPEPPGPGEAAAHDCANDDRPTDPIDGANRVVDQVDNALSDPTPISGWFPTCVSLPIRDGAYVAYDVAEGRYYVEAPVPALPTGLGTPEGGSSSSSYTGTSGMSIEADCISCPQPP